MEFVDAGDVADEVAAIETCGAVVPQLCPSLQRDRARNPVDGWETWNVTARLYRFRNVVLDRTHMVLLHDGRIIAQTNYLQPAAALAALRVSAGDLIRVDPGDPAAICFDHWDGNYYHWTAHSIPAVHAILARHPGRHVRLVLPSLQPWQQESLRLMGASALPAVTAEAGRQYFFPALEYLDITAGSLDFAVSPMSRGAYDRLAAAAPNAVPRRPRLYIDRSATANRRVGNEAALAERLQARGFDVVRPETLTLAEQVTLFRGASMVVGMLGAGLANIAYCRPGTVVYEIMPEHHLNPCFMVMALQGELQYWADMFPSGVAGHDHYSPWACDLDVESVMRRVGELEPLCVTA